MQDPNQPIDRRDGSTKGEVGITTVANMFCPNQIAVSSNYLKTFEDMTWAPKDSCQIATCKLWNMPECWHQKTGRKPAECPAFEFYSEHKYWPWEGDEYV